MKGFILAAGEGRRMQPFTLETPKPLLPFFHTTPLDLAVEKLSRVGVDQIYINVSHLKQKVQSHLNIRGNALVKTLQENRLLGTGGAFIPVIDEILEDEVLVHNSDIVSNIDLTIFVEHHKAYNNDATMLVLKNPDPKEPKVFCLDDQILSIGTDHGTGNQLGYGYGCVQVFGPRFTQLFRKYQAPFSIIDVYREAISLGLRIGYYPYTDFWADLGTPSRYWNTHKIVLNSLSEGFSMLSQVTLTEVDRLTQMYKLIKPSTNHPDYTEPSLVRGLDLEYTPDMGSCSLYIPGEKRVPIQRIDKALVYSPVGDEIPDNVEGMILIERLSTNLQ